MMEDAISGMDSTVAVASRSAYSLPSAGATCGVCPMNASRCWINCARNSSIVRLVRNPGIDSSLSSVPPVWPSARPEIIGTVTPAAAASGAAIRLVLSPTPPVECLSTLTPGTAERSTLSPELDHAVGQGADLPVRHAGVKHRHKKRRHLVIRDGAAGIAVNEEGDFFYEIALPRPSYDGSGRPFAFKN